MKVEAHRAAINALGRQSAARFAEVHRSLDRHDEQLTKVAVGQQQIVDLLTTVIFRQDEQ